MSFNGSFSDFIKEKRQSQGLSVNGLSTLAGKPKSFVQKIEDGANIGADGLMLIIKALKMDGGNESIAIKLWMEDNPGTKMLFNRMIKGKFEKIASVFEPI